MPLSDKGAFSLDVLPRGFGETLTVDVDMPHRTFTDAEGVEWQVYDVTALPGFIRSPQRPIESAPGVFSIPERWLAFECATEKRRLSPIPGDWEAATTEQLEQLLTMAMRVRAL